MPAAKLAKDGEAVQDVPAAAKAGALQTSSASRPRAQGETTSRVLPRPVGWQEEGILLPHEGIRFLMGELSEAVRVMDAKAAWKWENLATWYQDYFYDVVHHHHNSEELIYFPWLQTKGTIPAKISADHPELMRAMDELRDMLASGALKPAGERAELLAKLRERVAAFVEDMHQHLAEEEEVIPKLLNEGGFTQEEEGACVGQIIESLGLDGNKKSLPVMLHGFKLWAGEERAEAFVAEHLPPPIRLLYQNFWSADFQQRHLGLVASLPEGVDVNPFASRGLGETTSRVLPRPVGWQEEGILLPHEGIRFLMGELSEAVRVMDAKAAWKWENLATWYQDYFYDVVHHHHNSEELIYFPWLQTKGTIPAKISADHPELMRAMDELRDMLASGALKPAGERAELLAKLRERVAAFVEDMHQHLAEEEEVIPKLLREGGFTQEEEGACVGQIIESLGLDGNKKSLPVMLHGFKLWAGEERAEAFVAEHLPPPIRLLYQNFWSADFQQRHLGLVASLPEEVDVNPFASRGLLCG
ncbi:unnamed protein product [Polarella glacialis]|uniref:Hemerythrin-like domain-containing protein n=1 Tax=Polarella glacialis TaxID=89957 RepID=A0A813FLF0_POLGL|nr:unnamed protein product [Polarella glacialis]